MVWSIPFRPLHQDLFVDSECLLITPFLSQAMSEPVLSIDDGERTLSEQSTLLAQQALRTLPLPSGTLALADPLIEPINKFPVAATQSHHDQC
jgi:hypothetical protein